jgi:regulatory protein YycH of two-component signal transduction system YycFG
MEKEKHGQPTMKYHLIVSLISKQTVLISSRTSHCNVHTFMYDNLESKQWQNMMFETEVN